MTQDPLKIHVFGNKYKSVRLSEESWERLKRIQNELNKSELFKKDICFSFKSDLPILIPLKNKLSLSDTANLLIKLYVVVMNETPTFNYQSWEKNKRLSKRTRKEAFKLYYYSPIFIKEAIEWMGNNLENIKQKKIKEVQENFKLHNLSKKNQFKFLDLEKLKGLLKFEEEYHQLRNQRILK